MTYVYYVCIAEKVSTPSRTFFQLPVPDPSIPHSSQKLSDDAQGGIKVELNKSEV